LLEWFGHDGHSLVYGSVSLIHKPAKVLLPSLSVANKSTNARKYTRSIDATAPPAFNWDMTRCDQCYSVITRMDDQCCYMCGEPVPGARKSFWRRKREPKPVAPVTPLSNLIFIASLALTLISFLSSETMSLPVSATLSGILLLARIFTDRIAAKKPQAFAKTGRRLALRPVPVARFYH
jgi:hypothetical protein